MDETLPSLEISVSEGERTNDHSTLERHDIGGVYLTTSSARCNVCINCDQTQICYAT